MIDAHCHLYEVPEEMWAGLDLQMICCGADFESSEKAIELAQKHSNVWATVGVHPEEMSKELDSSLLLRMTKEPKVVAIGECGLDSDSEEEVQLFKVNIELAKETGLPLVVHCRNQFKKVYSVLSAKREVLRGIQMHCWTGDQ
ncbi:MAG: TatD family hydrolase, partial [Patescibacteria group bacterium]